ncbi:hypothetical protein R1flu_006134 [Riccia fluitans]|uniref:Secreted protein n=1 Tax=Riccia fluitans TaxID=41844 RepID=A0ABD1YV66_9MARC
MQAALFFFIYLFYPSIARSFVPSEEQSTLCFWAAAAASEKQNGNPPPPKTPPHPQHHSVTNKHPGARKELRKDGKMGGKEKGSHGWRRWMRNGERVLWLRRRPHACTHARDRNEYTQCQQHQGHTCGAVIHLPSTVSLASLYRSTMAAEADVILQVF